VKIDCERCGGVYDEGFYAQHRVIPEHAAFVTEKQRLYGGPTVFCQLCEQPYPPGTYDEHKFSNVHILNTKWGRMMVARREGITALERRDAYILAGIRGGRSYGELATELSISRQRVHQIAAKLGVHSTGKHSSALMRACFYDGKPYSDWTTHASTADHTAAVIDFGLKVGNVKRTGNAGGAGLGAGHTAPSKGTV